jgi:hypothetical protein
VTTSTPILIPAMEYALQTMPDSDSASDQS